MIIFKIPGKQCIQKAIGPVMRYQQKFSRLVLTTLPLIIIGFLAILRLPYAAGGEVATFQGIGDLPGGGFYSIAFGVSADGSTVVGWGLSSAAPDSFEAIRWTALGGMVSLGDGGLGLERSSARAASGDGAVIVGRASMPGASPLPFRWTALTGMEVLIDTTGSMTRGTAFDVSDDGAVIVGVGNAPSPNQAFRWEASSGMVGLGWLPSSIQDSFAFGVSADGSAICGISFSGLGFDVEPFRWTLGGGMVGIGDVPGGIFYAIAFAISGDGTTLVGPARTSSGADELFIWSQSSGFILPDSIHGATFSSTAWSVNHDGTVVVGCTSSGPMIWDAANGMRDLQEVLAIEFGLDLTGWTIGSVRGISADGTVIVGAGINPDGNSEGWIATLPITTTGISAPSTTNRFLLTPAYPNPFDSSVEFWLETRESFPSLRATIYGVDGAVVRVLIDDSYPAGVYKLRWNGRDSCGRRVPSGLYFLRVNGGGETVTQKLIRLR